MSKEENQSVVDSSVVDQNGGKVGRVYRSDLAGGGEHGPGPATPDRKPDHDHDESEDRRGGGEHGPGPASVS